MRRIDGGERKRYALQLDTDHIVAKSINLGWREGAATGGWCAKVAVSQRRVVALFAGLGVAALGLA